jgi:hypothetical protein
MRSRRAEVRVLGAYAVRLEEDLAKVRGLLGDVVHRSRWGVRGKGSPMVRVSVARDLWKELIEEAE